MNVQNELKKKPEEIVSFFKTKSVKVPAWEELEKEYNPKNHPIFDKSIYPDTVKKDGSVDKVSRIGLGFQKLAAKRMAQLAFGIPVKRVYRSENDSQAEIAKIIEAVFTRNRIDSVNIDRGKSLFGACELFTLWYSVEDRNHYYGIESPIKIRCKTYAPIAGDGLYPLFDEYGDLIAMSFSSKRREHDAEIEFLDVFTKDRHLRLRKEKERWSLEKDEAIAIGKIPGVYASRSTPIWEDNSETVYEMEWSLSRNGNYLRRNSRPVFGIFADDEVKTSEGENTARDILRFPKGSDAKYITWPQAVDNLKFHITELRQLFFSIIQIPDFSFENMKTTPMSGEARKMMFIDAQLKVTEEQGPLLAMLDREVNVVKAFVKAMLPTSRHIDVDLLKVESIITPFSISNDKETVDTIMTATGGKAVMSRLEGIKYLGYSDNAEETLRQIQDDEFSDVMEPSY